VNGSGFVTGIKASDSNVEDRRMNGKRNGKRMVSSSLVAWSWQKRER
jgi:hypothetical protein